MKKITKLVFSCAAVAALTAAVGTAAMAAKGDVTGTITGDITGSYDPGTKTITVTDYASTGEESTMLVLNNDASTVAEGDIEAINQEAKIATIPLGIENPAEGETATYYIRIGGSNGEIRTATLTIATEGEDGPAPSTQKLGDVNNDGSIQNGDATDIAKHVAGLTVLEGDNLQAADVNDDGQVANGDATDVAKFIAGLDSSVDGNKTVGDKTKPVAAE